MLEHAGFGAAAVIKQSAMQDAITIYHRAGAIPSTITFDGIGPLTDPSGSQVTIGLRVFLDAPQITLRGTDDVVRVRLDAQGTLSLTNAGTGREEFPVRARILARVRPFANLSRGTLVIGLDYSRLTIDQIWVEPTGKPAVPAWLRTTLDNSFVRALIAAQLRATGNPMSSPILLDQVLAQLEPLGLRMTSAALKVLDGALGLGVNLFGEPAVPSNPPLILNGSIDRLRDFCPSPQNLAFTVHPDVGKLMFLRNRDWIVRQARAQAGVRVDHLDLQLVDGPGGDGDLLVIGGATVVAPEPPPDGALRPVPPSLGVGGGSIDARLSAAFAARLRPSVGPSRLQVLVRSFTITGLPAWTYFIAIVTSGIVTPLGTFGIFSAIVDRLADSVSRNLHRIVAGTIDLDRVVTVTLPDTLAPNVSLSTDVIQLNSGGMTAALTVSPAWTGATRIAGPGRALGPGWDLGPADASLAVFRLVGAEPLFHPNDPRVWIRWWIRREDTGATIVRVDRAANDPSAASVTFDMASPAAAGCTRFSVHCEAYRPFTSVLYRGSTRLLIFDPLDRSRPFVRWRHATTVPDVYPHTDADGRTTRVARYPLVYRKSRIHRTAVPGRCRFAHQYSPEVFQTSALGGRPNLLEYLDELPFPRSELVARRQEVCDYCFFGGPTRDVPLI
ncbi:MAG TPA: hypothetical protein VFC19_14280 [Candidatus Limnocylindrales bacterium]|nr:hypothetical protein [Candidatus Limnocylindrales bacterium]